MEFRVLLKDSKFEIINADGAIVPNARVKSINFEEGTSYRINGAVHYPTGIVTASIIVNNEIKPGIKVISSAD